MLYKKGVLKANTSARVPFTFPGSMERPAILFKKGSGTGVFLKFCEISKNTVWHRTHLVAGSEQSKTQESKT